MTETVLSAAVSVTSDSDNTIVAAPGVGGTARSHRGAFFHAVMRDA